MLNSSLVHRILAEPSQQQQSEQYPDGFGIPRPRWRRPGAPLQFALAGVQFRTALVPSQFGRRARQRRTRRTQQRWQHQRQWHTAADREPTGADQVHREYWTILLNCCYAGMGWVNRQSPVDCSLPLEAPSINQNIKRFRLGGWCFEGFFLILWHWYP